MHKLQSWLAILLVLQIIITAGIYALDQQQSLQNQQHILLNFDDKQLDRIVIAGKDKSLTLQRSGDSWRLPQLEQLQADTIKLNALLDKLKHLKGGWPVATTTGSHQRFEVADDHFQRRLQLFQGEHLVSELFIGSSPGFRKSYIRLANGDVVYAAKLNSFELPVQPNDWLDKGLLAIKNVTGIKGPDYTLEKIDNKWRFSGGDESPNTQVDQDKARKLAAALSSLRVLALLTKSPEETLSDDKAIDLEISTDDKTLKFRFFKDEEQYFVKRNDSDKLFLISQLDFDRIAKVGLAELILTETSGNLEPNNKPDNQ